ncbi:ABC transporter substrate-binding protein [Kushneria pakistanensis]|uniref:sn-glycerol-3-phosphate-binding periplasmic protein UgpB n=1 Tax=Kushneria pakistanensis TaxID=1508770 RepID=A0ABQ3FNT1_9GAMM|nr:sn-glycerol-3-phosphate ABC transporter substrate-binding protein UgpB [Kushneria pakistanensis]GHC31778.1 ABC transporter substrate-binding protein [Kushneria pakistanensis]
MVKGYRGIAGVAALSTLALGATSASAATDIVWWHAMEGGLGDKVNEIAEGFNQSQSDYVVKPVYKGTYSENMTSTIAAFRAGNAPAITQVYEVGTATMMNARGAIYPVYELMADTDQPFDPASYLPAVTGYYSTTDGEMLSLPFNSSTPVVYYNRDLFEKAGLDPDAPPTTWEEVAQAGKRIVDSGAASCGFTTTWPSWIQLENFAARHDIPFASEQNGFGGPAARLTFNDSKAVVAHVQDLIDWQKNGVFGYGGREDQASPRFFSGRCAMLMASSASYASVRDNTENFEFGVAPLPWDPEVIDQPKNSIIGGASLWVLKGQDDDVYQGVARFFNYLSSPEVQADWHQFTGYLPITDKAYALTREQHFYEENPGTEIALKQMTEGEPSDNSRGLRLGNMPQIREVIEEELERAFSGDKSAQQALDSAAKRGNELLEQFERSVR